MSSSSTKSTRRVITSVIGIAVGVALMVFAFWAWHGTITAVARGIVASASWKVFLLCLVGFAIGLVVAIHASSKRDAVHVGYNASEEERAQARKAQAHATRVYRIAVTGTVIVAVIGVLAILVGPSVGGYYRGTQVAASATTTDTAQPEYDWRTPWTVASASASSRAGNVVGDFRPEDTTYLPLEGKFVTPVQARGFASGLSTVVVQDGSSTAKTCTFATEAPVNSGMFAANLSRAISFIDAGLEFNPSDAWVYCDGDNAKMVVPVIRMIGQPEATPVPAGVVIYDGAHGTLVDEVKKGDLPGPVYPSGLAAAQRDSLSTSQGLLDSIFGRAGYETTEDVDGDPNNGNTTEILLARADKSGYDYVTPLTPRGKSFTVTAIAVVPADHVKAGELNALTVHKLSSAREGNQAISDRIKAAFPNLGWAAGLQIVEVVPTSAGTWEATLSNGRAVANRVAIDSDGTLCLKETNGRQLSCVTVDGASQSPTNATGASETASLPSGNLAGLSDSELAQLAVDVANEQLRRTTSAQ